MIRLDTFPTADIAAFTDPGNPPPSPSVLTCLLHSGSLAVSHQLVVLVGGSIQTGTRSGDQEVYTWCCGPEVEMEIRLLVRGQVRKAWRGWWKGGTTLTHTGTLPVQVFCAGHLQLAGIPTPPPEPPSLLGEQPAQHNGFATPLPAEEQTPVRSWPALAERPPVGPSPSTTATPPQETALHDHPGATEPEEEEDDLWQQQEQGQELTGDTQVMPREKEELEEKMGSFEWEEEEEEDDTDDLEWEEEEEEDDRESFKQEEWGEREGRKEEESGEEQGTTPRSQPDTLFSPSAPITAPDASSSVPVRVPDGTMVATLGTSSARIGQEQPIQRLNALLSTMPAQTVLVDLRQHARGARQKPALHDFSKEALRAQYGGQYWDRGSLIQTAPRLLSGRPSRWETIVTNPEAPEGIETLVDALAHGFSLVLLDQGVSYAESARAAVLAHLQRRVVNLMLGPCS